MAGTLAEIAEKILLGLFAASSLFFVFEVGATLGSRNGVFFWPFLIAVLLVFAVAAFKFPRSTVALAVIFFLAFVVLFKLDRYTQSFALQLLLLSFPFAWLRLIRRKSAAEMFTALGFRSKMWWQFLIIGFLIGGLVHGLTLAVSLVLKAVGVGDGEKVIQVLEEAPFALLIFAFTVAPLAEEIFFRGFLMQGIEGMVKWLKRFLPYESHAALGISASLVAVLFSSVIFSLAHVSYQSISELVGVFLVGLVFAGMFILTRSIWLVYGAHMSFNLIAIVVFLAYQYLKGYLPVPP